MSTKAKLICFGIFILLVWLVDENSNRMAQIKPAMQEYSNHLEELERRCNNDSASACDALRTGRRNYKGRLEKYPLTFQSGALGLRPSPSHRTSLDTRVPE
jgi:hypothetical protein